MIYIHVPFCHRKCTYCAFFSKPVTHSSTTATRRSPSPNFAPLRSQAVSPSEPGRGEELDRANLVFAGYVDALINEMRQRRGEQAHPIKTVYFGGGTPSILAISDLERITKALHDNFDLSQVEEVTMECNPEDLTDDYIHGIRQLGLINRLSIGIQSLDDSMLRLLNRRHTAAQAIEAVENAYHAGFHNLSVDFIYGLPKEFQFSIFNFQLVTHLSAYTLTIEPGTALAVQVEQGRVVLPDDDEVVRQYHTLRQHFESMGFSQYEVSNFARPGFESKHNSRYWDRTPYLGLGPGAHSFSLFDGGSTSVAHVEKRRWNKPDGTFEQETLTETDAFNELLMTALRTTRGLSLDAVPEEYKERLHHKMQPYIDCGWIVVRSEAGGMRYEPTPEGLLHADGIAAALFA